MAALMSLLPDLLLLALALAVLTVDVWKEDGETGFHATWIGLAGLAVLIGVLPAPSGGEALAGYRASAATQSWKLLFILATLGTVLLARPYFRSGGNARGTLAKSGAFTALLLLCLQGMFALVSADNLLTFYLGLELATMPI